MKCPRVDFSIVVDVEFLSGAIIKVIPFGLRMSGFLPVTQRFF